MRQQTNSFENLITRRVRTGRLRRFVAMLSAFVLLTTMNTLKLNADTLERIATCGIAQHVHDESCYDADGELACGLEEHVHTDACYQQRPTAEDKASTRIDEYVPLDAQVRLASPVEFISEDDEDTSVEISDVDDAVDEVMAELQNGDADDRGDEDDIDLLFTPDDEEALPVSGEDATEIDDTIFEVEGEEDTFTEIGSDDAVEMIDAPIEGEVIEGEVTEGESIEGEVIEGETIEVETTDEENTKYTYELGDRREVLLSAVLDELELQLDQIDSASVARSDEAVLSVALNEDGDYVITALEGFEKGEIVVVGMEGETVAAYIIAINASKAKEQTEVGEEAEAVEAPEIKTEEEVTEEKKDAEETVEEETEKAEENAEEQTEVEEIKDEDGAEEVQESDEESEAAEVAIVENDNVTIVPVGDNSLSGNLEIVYNENVNKQSVVDRLDAILSGAYQPGMMSTSSAAMSGLALAGASAGNETAGQYSDYAVFNISLLDDGVQRSETGEVGVVVRPENVNIYDNLPGNATATNVEYTLYHIHNSAADTLPVSVDCGEDGSLLAVDFTTDSFSYFVLKYTVDFQYGDEEISIEGETQVLLSTLIKKLKIVNLDGNLINVNDIVSVEFTNDHVVTIEEVSGEVEVNGKMVDVGTRDFLLTSKESFNTSEKLAIVTHDGLKYQIGVTDPITQLPVNDYVTNATLTDASGKPIDQDENGNYIIKDANNYDLTLHIEEAPGKQFDQIEVGDGGIIHHYMPDLVYTIPEGVTLQGGGAFNMKVGSKTIQNNTYTVQDGKIIIHFNENDPNYNTLLNSPKLYMDLEFGVRFTHEEQHTEFGTDGKGTIDIVKDTSHDATVDKSITNYNETTGMITYQVDVVSTGVSKGINVQDTISGSLLSNYQNMSVSVLNSKNGYAQVGTLTEGNGYTSTPVEKGFNITIDELQDGQVARIQYEVMVDQASVKKSGNATFDETGNKVTINVPGDDDTTNNEDTEHKKDINVSSMKKTSTSTSDVYKKTINGEERELRDISYQIEVNPEMKVSLAGTPITDTNLSTNLAKYGEKVSLVVTNSAGTEIRTEDLTPGEGSWTYNVPSDDGPYKYVFTYTTTVDVTGWEQAQQVKNSATYKYGGDGTTINVPPPVKPAEPKEQVSKYAVDFNEETITWKITIDVPAEGTGAYSIKDAVPKMADWPYYDYVDSIVIDGLTDNEKAPTEDSIYIHPAGTQSKVQDANGATSSYPVGADLPAGEDYFTIDFKHGTTPGFEATGSNRTVTVTVVTRNNPYWMEYVREKENSGWVQKHTNNVTVTKDNQEIEPGNIEHPSDYVQPVPSNIQKKQTKEQNYTFAYDASGRKLPAFRFEVVISGSITGDIDIKETFDTRFFKVLTDHYNMGELTDANHLYYGIDMWQFMEPNPNVLATVISTSDGARLHIDAQNVPKINDLAYSYYKLYYYLVPIDWEHYEALKAFVAQNGVLVDGHSHGDTTKKYTFNNIAEFAGIPATADYEYEVTDIIEKSGTNAEDGDVKGLLKYTIIYNKDKVKLNNGDGEVIYDLLENAVPYKFDNTNYLKITVEHKDGSTSTDYTLIDEGVGQTAPDGATGILVYYNSVTQTFSYIENVPDESKVTIEYWAKPAYTVVNGDENKGRSDYGKALSDVSNTVSVEDFNYSIDNHQEYDVLNKERNKNGDNSVTYTVKFNDHALMLNEQVDFPVTDTVKGITIRPESFVFECAPNTVMHKETASSAAVEITDVATFVKNSMQTQVIDEETGEVKYSFTIPDGVFVKITYVGDPIYKLGEEGKVVAEYSNTVEGDNIVKYIPDKDEDKVLRKTFGDYVAYIDANAGNPNIGTIPFTIVFNPTKAELNEGQDMELTDSFTNLSVVYSSIQIVTDPAENQSKVTYDYSGNTGYYVIPDRTKVTLTYNATPIFDVNNQSTWNNEVKVKGFKDDSHDTTEDHSHVSGGGDEENHLYLFKYEKGNMRNSLEGITFSLLTMDDNGEFKPVKDLSNRPIKFTTTTDQDKGSGYVKIALTDLTGHELEKNKVYYLHEDAAPEGYYEDDVYYNFMLVDSSSDYSAPDGIYAYKNGDILKVSNKPITDDVVAYKEWATGDGTNDWPETYDGTVDLKLVLYNTKTSEEKAVAMPQTYYGEDTMPENLQNLAYLTNGASYEEWSESTKTLSKDSRNVTWKDLDQISDALANAGWVYKVKEVDAESGQVTLGGVTYQVIGGEVSKGEATITNAEVTDIEFEKKWQNIPDTITIPRPADATYVNPANLDGDNVNIPFSSLRLQIQLHRYVIKNGRKIATYDFDLTDPDEVKIGEPKVLYGAKGSDFSSDVYEGIFEKQDPPYWSANWQNLPTAGVDENGAKINYIYEVEEKMVTTSLDIMNKNGTEYVDFKDQFKSTSSTEGNKRIINNRLKSDTNYYLSVTKKWLDADGNPTSDAPEISFKLLRDSTISTTVPGEQATIRMGSGDYWDNGWTKTDNTDFKVGDTVKLSFETTGWFNGYGTIVGAVVIDDNGTGNVGTAQMRFRITDTTVNIPVKGGGTSCTTEYSFELVEAGQGTTTTTNVNDQVLMPSGDTYVVDPDGAYTFTLDPGETVNFKNLPSTERLSDSSVASYIYKVIEVIPAGSKYRQISVTPATYDATPENPDDDGKDGEIVITNQRTEKDDIGSAQLTINKEKKGTPNTKLAGVTFTLTDASDNTIATGETDANGALTLTIPKTALSKHNGADDHSTTKTFTLTETVPEGYLPVEDNPWTVTVTANGTEVTTVNEIVTTTYKWHVTSVGELTGDNYVYTIVNEEAPKDGNLKLSKTTDPTTSTEEFEFTIQFSGEGSDDVKGKTFEAEGKVSSVAVGSDGKATVSLKNDEFVLIKGLPAGVTYTVTEGEKVGWTNTVKTGESGSIVANETAEASFTNVYDETEATPEGIKTLTGRDWNNDSFSFTLTPTSNTLTAIADGKVKLPVGAAAVSPYTMNGTATRASGSESVTFNFGDITFLEAGSYTFEMKETKGSADSIQYATNTVTVTVTVPNKTNGKFATAPVVTYTNSDTTQGVGNNEFVNTYDATTTFTPKAKKVFTKGTFSTNQFTFILTEVADATATTTTGTEKSRVSVSNSEAVNFPAINYKLADLGGAASKTFYYIVTEDIPEAAKSNNNIDPATGIRYDPTIHHIEVTLTDNGDGTLNKAIKMDGNSVEEAAVVASFTNEQLGSVEVTKSVSGTDLPAGFKITNNYNSDQFTVSNAAGTNPYTWKIDNVPLNTTITFTEENIQVDGYSLSVNGTATTATTATASVTWNDKTATASFVNVYTELPGSLKLKKIVNVNGTEVTSTTAANDKALVDGIYTFTVASTTLATTVSKTVTIEFENGEIKEAKIGDDEVVLTDGWVVVDNLPADTYTVTEGETPNGTSLVGDNNLSVLVSKGDTAEVKTASFTNNIDTGDLELTKTVTGKTDTTTEFEFEISLTAPKKVTLASNYTGTVAGTETTFNIVEGKVKVNGNNVKLKHGEKVVINDLPAGTHYKVSEVNVPTGFTPNLNNGEGDIPVNNEGAKAKAEVTANNVFAAEDTTTFNVKKNFTGGDLKDKQFSFKLTQVDAENSTTEVTTKLGSPVTVQTTATEGSTQTLNFTLPGTFKFTQDDIGKTFWFMIEEIVPDEAKTSPFIADGVKYANPYQQWVSVTITENNGELVVTKSTTGTNPDAEFTNEQLGKLVVTKTFEGNAVDNLTDAEKKAITFSITGPTGFTAIENRPLSDESFVEENGVYTLTLEDIPLGDYTVTESNTTIGNYKLTTSITVDEQSSTEGKATLSAADTEKDITFTNKYEKYQLEVTKSFEGATLTDGQKNAITLTVSGKGLTGTLEHTYAEIKAMEGGKWILTTADNNIQPDVEYTVTETNADVNGYTRTTTYKVNNGAAGATNTVTLESDQYTGASVEVVNKYRDAELVIKKTVTGPALADALAKITFTIEDVTEGIDDQDRTSTITVQGTDLTVDGESASKTFTSLADNIKPDHTYKVTETIDDTLQNYKWKSVTTTIVTGIGTNGTTVDATVTLTNGDTSEGEIDFANTYDELIDVEGTKTWRVSEGVTPNNADITLKLERTLKPATDESEWSLVEATPTWTDNNYKFVKLDKYNADKVEYEYRVTEVSFKIGETTYTVDAATGIATPDVATKLNMKLTQTGNNFVNEELTKVKVNKTWNTNGAWPEGYTVEMTLKADDQAVTTTAATNGDVNPATLNSQKTNTTWINLPKFKANGEEITYTVEETRVLYNGTEVTKEMFDINGNDELTNGETTYDNTPKTTERHAKKIWDDNNDAEGKRPASVTFTLTAKADGETDVMDDATLAAEGITTDTQEAAKTLTDWTKTIDWTDLPEYTKAGKKITYDVVETPIQYYTLTGKAPEGNIYTFTNTLGSTSVPINATKTMKGGETPKNEKYSFTLTPNDNAPWPVGVTEDEKITGKMTRTNDATGAVDFGSINFTVQDMEDATQVEGEGNEAKVEKTFTYTVTEVDKSADNPSIVYDKSVYTVTVKLVFDSKDGTLSVAENYPIYTKVEEDAGTEETGAPETELEQLTDITFENEELTEVTVEKVWKNSNDNTPPAGAEIELSLYKSTDTEFEKPISTIKLNGKTDVETISENEEEAVAQELLSETDNGATNFEAEAWKGKWTNLPKYEGGVAIIYVVKETENNQKNYRVTYDDGTYEYALNEGTITNTEEETELTGRKVWVDEKAYNADATGTNRPKSLEIKLYAFTKTTTTATDPETGDVTTSEVEGEAVEVTLQKEHDDQNYYLSWDQDTDANVWVYTITHLPKKDAAGNEICYRVEETLPTGYRTDNGGVANMGVAESTDEKIVMQDLVNTELTELVVQKKWEYNGKPVDPNHEEWGNLPETVYFHLQRGNGTFVELKNDRTIAETNLEDTDTDNLWSVEKGSAQPYYTMKIEALDKYYLAEVTTGEGSDAVTTKKVMPLKYYIKEVEPEGWSTKSIVLEATGDPVDSGHTVNDGTIVITNSKYNVSLPSTGGPGTTGLYILGSILTFLAAVLLITKKRTDGQGIE